MDQRHGSNNEVGRPDIFSVLNNYFLLFFCASCMISSMYIQQLFYMIEMYRVGIAASAGFGIILPMYLLMRRFGDGFRITLRMVQPRVSPSILVVLATLCSVVIVDQIYLITQQFSPVPEQYTETLMDIRPNGGWTFALTFAGLCVLVPFAEEIIFRGVIQQIFARNMGGVVAFVLSGLLFGAAHLNAHLLVSITFFGLFLSFVYFATGNLTYCIVAHSLFNTIALLQLTFTPEAQSGADLPFYLRDIRVFVVAAVLLAYFLYKLKKGGPETEPPWEPLDEDETPV